jgi:hypothetical protein
MLSESDNRFAIVRRQDLASTSLSRNLATAPEFIGSARTQLAAVQNKLEKIQYRTPEIIMAAGRVSTQASAILRTVESCNPEPFAAMVPAIPEDSTCVVETGNPYTSAAAIVAAAVISAQAPWA